MKSVVVRASMPVAVVVAALYGVAGMGTASAAPALSPMGPYWGHVSSDCPDGKNFAVNNPPGVQPCVKAIQGFLRGVYPDDKTFDTLKIDGIYGPQTEAAVRKYQAEPFNHQSNSKYPLAVDGIAGPKTIQNIKYWEKLDNQLRTCIATKKGC